MKKKKQEEEEVIKILSSIFYILNKNANEYYNHDLQQRERILFFIHSYLQLVILFQHMDSNLQLNERLIHFKYLLQHKINGANKSKNYQYYHLILMKVNEILKEFSSSSSINEKKMHELKKRSLKNWFVYLLSHDMECKNLLEIFIGSVLDFFNNITQKNLNKQEVETSINILNFLKNVIDNYQGSFCKRLLIIWREKIKDFLYILNKKLINNQRKASIYRYALYLLILIVILGLMVSYMHTMNVTKKTLLKLILS
jgi:hypothetical protein